MPLVWLLHRNGYPAADRISGPDLMPAIFWHSERRGYRHFLYGSSETTLASLRQNLKRDFPQARIVGQRSPPFRVPTADEERHDDRSEEHTSELQSLLRISYAVLCLHKHTNIK